MKEFYLKPELLNSLKGYTKKQLLNDIIAGIIVAIIALPLSIALALASGVEPACGVYTAIAAGFVVSLLGGSRVQIAGPTAAFATIVAGVVAAQGMDGLFLATVMAGLILIILGVCKLGTFIKYMPHTITVGFTGGIAVTILLGQIKDFAGITYDKGIRPIETLEKMEANIEFFSTFSPWALIVGAVSLLILIFYPRLEKRVPPSLIAVIVSALAVKLIPVLGDNVFTIGDLYTIPTGLPKMDFGAMDISLQKIIAVIPNAFTIAILAAIESLLSCVVADTMVNAKHNPNTELVAQGFGNIASVFFGGIPATGAIARTSANAKNGGKTPIAGMVHAIVLLLVLLFLMPYAALIPMPTIAAILFMVAYNMSEWRKFVKIIKQKSFCDIAVLCVTFALTVIFDLVVAIAAGLALHIVFVIIKKLLKGKTAKKIYVFDLDGVLIDSMPRYEAAMLSILDDAGISYDSELIKFITPLGYTKTAEHYITLGVNDTVENMVNKMRERLVFEYTNNIKLKPGVKEYLEKLKGENARLFVLTASPHIVTDVCLTNNGVFHLFEKVWSVEDFGLTKSDMKLFDDVSAAIGCSNSDINYFDDNLIAVTNAAKVGYLVFGVYDRHDERDTAELKEKAGIFVPSFEELL